MKITIDLGMEKKFYSGEPVEKFLWRIDIPRKYSPGRYATMGSAYDFSSALEAARKTATSIYEFNVKRRKFPYVEEFDPSEVSDA